MLTDAHPILTEMCVYRTTCGMNLAAYMASKSLDDAQMGDRIGKSRSRVNLYRRGLEAIPSNVVKQLVEMSGGEMTANELLGIAAEAAQ